MLARAASRCGARERDAQRALVVVLYGPSFPEGKEFTVSNTEGLKVEGLIYGTYEIKVKNAGDYIVKLPTPITLSRQNLQEAEMQPERDEDAIEKLRMEITRLESELSQGETLNALNTARAGFDRLMQQVNSVLEEVLNPRDEEEEAFMGGGCGSAGGCAGCSGCS